MSSLELPILKSMKQWLYGSCRLPNILNDENFAVTSKQLLSIFILAALNAEYLRRTY
jgi:hypothetical protein